MKSYRETKRILTSTKKPDVFFGRLNFYCDLLLNLQQYEHIPGMFTSNNPSSLLSSLESTIDKFVSDFVLRYMADVREEVQNRASKDAKEKYYEKALVALISAFDCANTFWTGNRKSPHYTGPLFSQRLYDVVQHLWDDFCDKDFSEIKI